MSTCYRQSIAIAGIVLFLAVAPAVEDPIRFVEVLRIGKAESDDETELLGGPQRIAVDGDGLIYLADHPRADVRVYGPDGSHRRDIGQRGRGPGELGQVSAIAIRHEGGIVVADRGNTKFVEFNADGHVVQEQPFPERVQVQPTFLAGLGENYVAYYRQPTASDADEVLHLFPPEIDRKLVSFGKLDEIWNPAVDAQRAIAGNPRGARVVTWDGAVCITSRIYDGTVSCFRNDGEDWDRQLLRGRAPERSHIVHPRANSGGPMQGDWLVSGPEGRFDISVLSSSRGFAATDEYLAHFTVRGDRRQKRLFVEVFDPEGDLIQYGEVSNYEPFDEPERAVFEVLCSTPDGNVYVFDMRDGYPVIKVIRLEPDLN